MWLAQLHVINYRSCKNVSLSFSKDQPNIFIGINDCGKSSILRAIGLLLAQRPNFHFPAEDKKKSDFSNSRIEIAEFASLMSSLGLPNIEYDQKQAFVIGKMVLEEEDKEDEKIELYSAHLQWVIDNLSSNEVWIMRVFDEDNSGIKDFIVTRDALENSVSLQLYKESSKNLKERASKFGLSNKDIQNENKTGRFKNNEYVNAIYKTVPLQEVWVEYSIKDDKTIFPEYSYLDWNMSMEQLQQVAKAAINTKITRFTESATRYAKRQSTKAQTIIDQELEAFTKQFAVELPNIQAFKSNVIFTLETKLTDILLNKNNTHGDIHLDSQGDGVKRQIWFALIKWSALNSLDEETNSKKFLWCFDEPETHLYPKAQRDFFQIIKQVSLKNIQSFISTHSTIFIDRAEFQTITKVELESGYSTHSTCNNTTEIFEALQIRNSDFLFFDKFLIVEGDTEEILIPHFYKLFSNETFVNSGIQLINLGGKDKRQQNYKLLKALLKDFNKDGNNIVYLFDNDISFDLTATELKELNYHTLGKQDIEDSISSVVWHRIITDRLSSFGIVLSTEELEELKTEIPSDRRLNSNQKFYSKIRNRLKQKLLDKEKQYLIDDLLPQKGRASGSLLASYIDDLSLIDVNFEEVFQALIN